MVVEPITQELVERQIRRMSGMKSFSKNARSASNTSGSNGSKAPWN